MTLYYKSMARPIVSSAVVSSCARSRSAFSRSTDVLDHTPGRLGRPLATADAELQVAGRALPAYTPLLRPLTLAFAPIIAPPTHQYGVLPIQLYDLQGEKTHDFSRGMNRPSSFTFTIHSEYLHSIVS